LPHPVEVALAMQDGYVFSSETQQALELALAHVQGDGKSLLARPEFAGTRAEGLHALAFTDVARLAQALEPFSSILLAFLPRRVGASAQAPESLHERLAGARPSLEETTLEHGQYVTSGRGEASLLAQFVAGSAQGSFFAGTLFKSLNRVERVFASDVERATADLRALQNAVDSYAIENAGRYPDSLLALVTPDEDGFTFIKGTEVPRDPWGREYGYEWDGTASGPRLFSLGADGRPGGTGADRDLENREPSRSDAK
jgi:general secretion pathway protein G